MSQQIINRIKARTGASLVDTSYTLNDIKRVIFDSGSEYEAIAEAAASVDAEIGNEFFVWGLGLSADGHPIVGIQRFETVDPSDVDTTRFNQGDYQGGSNRAASRQTYTNHPGD